MSFKEKVNLAMLVILAGVFGWYFGVVIPPFAGLDDLPSAGSLWGLMIFFTVLPLTLSVVALIILASLSPKEAGTGDERDRRIEIRAEARSAYVLTVGVIGAIGFLLFDTEPFWVANALLASLAASEIVKAVLRAVAYRRGV